MSTQHTIRQKFSQNRHRIASSVRNNLGKNRLTYAVIGFTLLAWQFYSTFINTIGDHYFPSPALTVQQTYANRYVILEGLMFTGTGAVLGLMLATVLGITLGILFAESYYIRNSFFFVVVFVYSLPAAILAPIFIIWFGTGIQAVAAFAGWTAFFPVFISTVTGMSAVDKEFEQFGELLGASRFQMLRHVRFWVALPNIISGIKVAVTLSMVGAIIAEYIATATGLGGQIVRGLLRFEEGRVFGVVFVIGIFSITLYKITCLIIDYLTPKTVS